MSYGFGPSNLHCSDIAAKNSMTRFTIHPDCGNAPGKLSLRDLNIAFAHADVEGILEHFAEDIHWQIVGQADLQGKDTVRKALDKMKEIVTSELVIHSILTHGLEGAVNGVIMTEQVGPFAFCDIYQFASASDMRIKSMMSYVVDLNSGE